MSTLDRVDGLVSGTTRPVWDWVQQPAVELYNAALEQPRFATLGAHICRDLIAQFGNEDEAFKIDVRADLGTFLFLADGPQEGETVLMDLIAANPDDPLGYVRLSDALSDRRKGPPLDHARAMTLLEEAIARPVRNSQEWRLEERLENLRSRVEQQA